MISSIKDKITAAKQAVFESLKLLVDGDVPILVTDSKELCMRLRLIDACTNNIRALELSAAIVDGNNDLPYEDERQPRQNMARMLGAEGVGPAPMEPQDMLGGLLGFLQNTLGGALRERQLETLSCTLQKLEEIKNLTLPEKARLNTIKTSLIAQLEKQVADHLKPTPSELDTIPPAPKLEVNPEIHHE